MPKPKVRIDLSGGKYKPDGIHMPTIDKMAQNNLKRPYNSKDKGRRTTKSPRKIEEDDQPKNARERSREQRDLYNSKLRQILMDKDQGAAFYNERTEHMIKVMERFEDPNATDKSRFYEGYPE